MSDGRILIMTPSGGRCHHSTAGCQIHSNDRTTISSRTTLIVADRQDFCSLLTSMRAVVLTADELALAEKKFGPIYACRFPLFVLDHEQRRGTRYYLDLSSLLIARARVRKALHPDLDPTETTIETVWTDFHQVAGVRFAFQANDTDLGTGKLLQTTTLLDLQANRPIDDTLFDMPGTAAGSTSGAAASPSRTPPGTAAR